MWHTLAVGAKHRRANQRAASQPAAKEEMKTGELIRGVWDTGSLILLGISPIFLPLLLIPLAVTMIWFSICWTVPEKIGATLAGSVSLLIVMTGPHNSASIVVKVLYFVAPLAAAFTLSILAGRRQTAGTRERGFVFETVKPEQQS